MVRKHAIRKILFDKGIRGDFTLRKKFSRGGRGVIFCGSKFFSGQVDCQGGGMTKVSYLCQGGRGPKMAKKKASADT